VTRLYSYCIPADDGAAPNPFWGTCTLVICKPAIRRVAQIGDWVIGTGSRRSPVGDISDCLVYAMRVTQKMTMREYDDFARTKLPRKIPEWNHRDPRRRLGDAIYDFSASPPRIRLSVHGEGNRRRDLSGRYALLSNYFFYFGDRPVKLPTGLRSLTRAIRGHRSQANDIVLETFLGWLGARALEPNVLYGSPQLQLFPEAVDCSRPRNRASKTKKLDCR
jgi:hypothetical protein